jgi:hypothetical protein
MLRELAMSHLRLLGLVAVACLIALAWASPPARALVSTGGGFYFQSPQAFGWTIAGVEFASNGDVWATANSPTHGQRLLHSDDDGSTW